MSCSILVRLWFRGANGYFCGLMWDCYMFMASSRAIAWQSAESIAFDLGESRYLMDSSKPITVTAEVERSTERVARSHAWRTVIHDTYET